MSSPMACKAWGLLNLGDLLRIFRGFSGKFRGSGFRVILKSMGPFGYRFH